MAFIPNVDSEKCTGCEECVEVCSASVFAMKNKKAIPMNKDQCVGCESCVEVCLENAITVDKTLHDMSEQCRRILKSIL